MKAIDRLYQYLTIKGIKLGSFERKYDLSNGYIAAMKKRGADMGESTLIKIMDACPDMDSMWFLTGAGEMMKADNKVDAALGEHYEQALISLYEDALEKKDLEIRRLLREVAILKAKVDSTQSDK